MRITVFGRGNVGGGLADLWERAGHRLTRLGRDGGDVSDADVVLVAVPGGAVAEAFDRLRGVEGKTVIDATNLYNVTPPDGFCVQRRVRQVQDQWTDGQVVQHKLRVALQPAGRGACEAEQPVVWRRRGARGRRAAQPRRRL